MVECYVDDIAVKSHSIVNHLHDLRTCSISCELISWKWTWQIHFWEYKMAIPWIHCHIQRNSP